MHLERDQMRILQAHYFSANEPVAQLRGLVLGEGKCTSTKSSSMKSNQPISSGEGSS